MASQSFPWRAVIAELVGTFLLTFTVSASISLGYDVPTALVAALTLAALVYALGPVSGAHVNPAVTAGLYGMGSISLSTAVTYIIAQVIGAIGALLALQLLLGEPALVSDANWNAGVAEFLGALVFVFGVATMVKKKMDVSVSGLVVGLSLFLGIAVASVASVGAINPAVAIGLGIFNRAVQADLTMLAVIYILLPLLGGLLAGRATLWIHSKK